MPHEYPYTRGSLIQDGLLVDVSELAAGEGISIPVAVSMPLARNLEPNDFLKGMGISFEHRVVNILRMLRSHLVSLKDGENAGLSGDRIIIPLVVIQGPLIREDILSVVAMVHPGDEGKMVITLLPVREDEEAA